MRQIKRLILHHTASSRDNTTLKQIDAWHKARWPNFKSSLGFFCGYHYVIGANWIKQTRSAQEDGAHTYGFNGDSIGICLTGNFETEQPNPYQLAELKKLVIGLMAEYKLSEKDVYLHRDLTATACPGRNFTKELVHNLLAIAPAPVPPPPSPDKQKLISFLTELTALINRYK